MRKVLTIIQHQSGISTLKVFGIVALAVIAVMLVGWGMSHANKVALDKEVAKTPPPHSCTEQNKEFTKGGIDTIPTWTVSYGCTGNYKDIYNVLKSNAKANGIVVGYDNSIIAKDGTLNGIALCLVNKKFQYYYSYINESGNILANGSPAKSILFLRLTYSASSKC